MKLFKTPTYEEFLEVQKKHATKNQEGIAVQVEYFDRADEIGKRYEEDRKLDLECTIANFRASLCLSLEDIELAINNKYFDKA